MTGIKPFFGYYGGKWRAAPRYPTPRYDTIVEPFAGAAGYSLRHHARKILLIEKNPKMAEIWRYLIRTPADEIRALPMLGPDQSVDDLRVPEAARYLIGLNLGSGAAAPLKRPTLWMRQSPNTMVFWCAAKRERIAKQVDQIRHWWVMEGDYTLAFDLEATWFIDPPYAKAGKPYPTQVDSYAALGDWCRSRRGQVIVCENDGADWLPFRHHTVIKANNASKVSHESIWINE